MRREWNIIGDVRGKGLMIGVELIEGNQDQDDNNEGLINPLNGRAISHIKQDCLKMGLLVGIGGNHSNASISYLLTEYGQSTVSQNTNRDSRPKNHINNKIK